MQCLLSSFVIVMVTNQNLLKIPDTKITEANDTGNSSFKPKRVN